MNTPIVLSIVTVMALVSVAQGQTSVDEPRPIPLTRPEMKGMLEDVKKRKPRIPLPESSAAEREQLGDRSDNYEARLRYHYLSDVAPAVSRSASGATAPQMQGRNADANMTLDYGFKVELFWIVSRTNNCQYCLGHQESKLLGAGLSEDRIASLDGDWRTFSPKEQAAYAFARKVTYEPHLFEDADFQALQVHFNDEQIIEMLISIAWNNSINRWKEGVGVPQSPDEGGYSRLSRLGGAKAAQAESLPSGSYLTPTSSQYERAITQVAPVQLDDAGNPTSCVMSKRPALESRDYVMSQLDGCRKRESRLPLVDTDTARQTLGLVDESVPVENWMRLLAHFPQEGSRRVKAIAGASDCRDLTPLTQSQLSWIVARQDRAWYAVERAYQQLKALGQSDDQIFALDGDWSEFSPSEQALFRIAQHLGASPVVLTDGEVAQGVAAAGPATVVQAINYVTQCAAFDRITEVANLRAE